MDPEQVANMNPEWMANMPEKNYPWRKRRWATAGKVTA